MSIFERRSASGESLIPSRALSSRRGRPVVTSLVAMQQSVIWAAVSLHAAIEAMMPVDIFRRVDGMKVQVPAPPVLISPSTFADGHPDSLQDWLYQRRMALGRFGNFFGEIVAFDSIGLPLRIQPIPNEDVSCKVKNRRIVSYKFGRTEVDPRRVWHDRTNLIPGVPIGLSPVAHALLTIETSESARRFAADWFGGSAFPGGHMKNTARTLNREQSEAIKARFAESQEAGGLLVTGSDWTFTTMQAKAVESGFLEERAHDAVDLCRFFNTPANMIDVATTGTARITYANITQANLDFMVTRMGPDLAATDAALSSLTPKPRFAKLTREAFLAMDPVTRVELMAKQIESRLDTPSHLRNIVDLPTYTEDDYAEFDRLFGSKNQTPTTKAVPA